MVRGYFNFVSDNLGNKPKKGYKDPPSKSIMKMMCITEGSSKHSHESEIQNVRKVQLDESLGALKCMYSVFQHGSSVEVFSCSGDYHFQPVLLHSFTLPGLECVNWSPEGTYLAGLQGKEVVVKDGADGFDIIMHLDADKSLQIQRVEFSPGENYLVLTCSLPGDNTHLAEVKFIDMKTGVTKHTLKKDMLPTNCRISWEQTKNDLYFAAYYGGDTALLFETSTFTCQTLKFSNLQDFSWSPSRTHIALFGASDAVTGEPGWVRLVDISNEEEGMFVFPGFARRGCLFRWQHTGDYLAVLYNQHNEAHNDGDYDAVAIFSFKDKAGRVFFSHRVIVDLSWEPGSARFARIRGTKNCSMTDVDIYKVVESKEKHVVKKKRVVRINDVFAKSLIWSPKGRYLVLHGLTSSDGELHFYDAGVLEMLASVKFMADDVQWDPTGRFVLAKAANCNGEHVVICSFKGEKLYEIHGQGIDVRWSKGSSRIDSVKDDHEAVQNTEGSFSEDMMIVDKDLLISEGITRINLG